MVYSAHSMLKEYYTFEEINWMPIKSVLQEIEYFKPKMKEIARAQETKKLEMELMGKQNQKRPNNRR